MTADTRGLPHDKIKAEGLDCTCDQQQPIRRLVEYGATTLSLLFCQSCGGLVIEQRRPDDVAVMRQDVAALRRIVAELYEQVGLPTGPSPAGAQRPSPAPLRVLPGGRKARPRER